VFKRLYVHIPFCLKKCSYCSFVSKVPQQNEQGEYVSLLLAELHMLSNTTTEIESIDSLYFGGGTPSLVSADQISNLIRTARNRFPLTELTEITLEVNPGTIVAFSELREAGINRLSLGIQSFDDRFLNKLGRIHSAESARHAFQNARSAGFDNVGIDLIHSLPGQSIAQWQKELEQALLLNPEHLSIYGLTIEEGTPLAQQFAAGDLEPTDDDLSADMFEMAYDLLTATGYEHYEIANYARPGFRSRHNCGYWQGDGYAGIGVAAHSLLKVGHGIRCSNTTSLDGYQTAISEGRLPRDSMLKLSREDAMAEYLFLGLRLTDGVDIETFEGQFNCNFEETYRKKIDSLIGSGLMELVNGIIRLTRRGMLLSNQVFSKFI